MDRLVEKKRGLRARHLPYLAGGVVAAIALGWLVFGIHASRFSVEREKIAIHRVARGEFNDYVRVNGQVQPINTVQLSAIEGGIVVERVVEEGAMVRAGDVVMRLSNSMLSLNILDSEAQLAEKQNFLRNTRVTMEQERLNLRREKLQLDLDIARKRRRHEQYLRLHAERLVSTEEYLQAAEEYEFSRKGRELVLERQRQDSIFRGIQVEQMEESLGNIRENLSLVRQRVDNLNVKSPVDGQLGLLAVQIGQSVGSGTRVGQVSVLSDYKIEARVDEHYIDRVRAGLDATFERQERLYRLVVHKVYPEVHDKQFKTDFVFEGERPDNIRAGQTYYINLQLGQPGEAILVPRGAFFQNTGGQWIFVLTPDGKRATRRPVRIGRQNPLHYEVLEGLEPGEEVITSSYDHLGDAAELILK
jgi:HlyD family secretion protein